MRGLIRYIYLSKPLLSLLYQRNSRRGNVSTCQQKRGELLKWRTILPKGWHMATLQKSGWGWKHKIDWRSSNEMSTYNERFLESSDHFRSRVSLETSIFLWRRPYTGVTTADPKSRHRQLSYEGIGSRLERLLETNPYLANFYWTLSGASWCLNFGCAWLFLDYPCLTW